MLEWSTAVQPVPGQSHAGDHYVVTDHSQGILIAVADGLGHGAEAADAARLACSLIEAHANEPIDSLIRRCHNRLRSTRGAVLSLALINSHENHLTWLGVGDVQAYLFRSDAQDVKSHELLMVRAGVVGRKLPRLEPVSHSINPGDTLLLFTDGIDPAGDWLDRPLIKLAPQVIARRVLEVGARGTDDALVLAARFTGAA